MQYLHKTRRQPFLSFPVVHSLWPSTAMICPFVVLVKKAARARVWLFLPSIKACALRARRRNPAKADEAHVKRCKEVAWVGNEGSRLFGLQSESRRLMNTNVKRSNQVDRSGVKGAWERLASRTIRRIRKESRGSYCTKLHSSSILSDCTDTKCRVAPVSEL